MNYKIGDSVLIYEDPITKKNLEGEAKIVKIHRQDDMMADCDVEFIEFDEPQEIYRRQIFKHEIAAYGSGNW